MAAAQEKEMTLLPAPKASQGLAGPMSLIAILSGQSITKRLLLVAAKEDPVRTKCYRGLYVCML